MSDIPSIAKQIQADIINPQIRLETILLKAKVLAHYLDNDELKKWVKNELNGYPDYESLPGYRIISSTLLGTFSNGVYTYSNRSIAIASLPSELRKMADNVYVTQNIVGVEEMTRIKGLNHPLPGDWLYLYNHFNGESSSYGQYQLIEAHHPIISSSMVEILGAIRSRLLDFVLEISNLTWDMAHEPPLDEQITKLFQVTINNSGELNMTGFQQKDGDSYNVGQAGAVGRYARSDGNTFIQSEQKQTLAEAAEEIQKLLMQLKQTNPSATQSEMIAYVNDETTPSLKRRTSSALKACGEAAIDEFVLENKFLKVIKATVKGWLEADS